jgi:hypothetical protein
MNFILPTPTQLQDGRVFRTTISASLIDWTFPRTHKLHHSPLPAAQAHHAIRRVTQIPKSRQAPTPSYTNAKPLANFSYNQPVITKMTTAS